MPKKIYLEGGGKVEEGMLREIDRQALDGAPNKNVVVLDLTSNDDDKRAKKRDFFEKYFSELGALSLNFASNSSIGKLKDKINSAGMIYIPGGDTELLIKNIKEKGLEELIIKFEGIIVGISAGAYLICKEYLKIRDSEVRRIKSLGVIDIRMKAHYEEKFDSELLGFSQKEDIYGVPDKSFIVFENGELNFNGDIYKFSKGEKIKVI